MKNFRYFRGCRGGTGRGDYFRRRSVKGGTMEEIQGRILGERARVELLPGVSTVFGVHKIAQVR